MDAPPKQRSPHQIEVLRQELVWGIFEDVWTQQNTILHNANSHVERAELTATTNKLL